MKWLARCKLSSSPAGGWTHSRADLIHGYSTELEKYPRKISGGTLEGMQWNGVLAQFGN